jgi:phosphotransferase system HPr-like phosphotransfer protein
MYSANISLSTIEAVKKFVGIANKYEFPITLITDKYKIDAKSIMGIFSLDLTKPVELEVEADKAEKFITEIEQFKVS